MASCKFVSYHTLNDKPPRQRRITIQSVSGKGYRTAIRQAQDVALGIHPRVGKGQKSETLMFLECDKGDVLMMHCAPGFFKPEMCAFPGGSERHASTKEIAGVRRGKKRRSR
jgi:hypothetical protein